MRKNEFQWETEEGRLKRHLRLSPKQKLQWLWQINEFVHKYSTPEIRQIRQRLRQGF